MPAFAQADGCGRAGAAGCGAWARGLIGLPGFDGTGARPPARSPVLSDGPVAAAGLEIGGITDGWWSAADLNGPAPRFARPPSIPSAAATKSTAVMLHPTFFKVAIVLPALPGPPAPARNAPWGESSERPPGQALRQGSTPGYP